MLTPAQLEIRRGGIGGSEIAAVVGVSPYADAIEIYARKLGLIPDIEPTEAMDAGTFLEPALANWYAYKTGATISACGTVLHPTLPHVLASPDGIAELNGERYLIEIKVPDRTSHHWGNPGTDQIPEYYIPQVQWTMACTNTTRTDVIAYIHGSLAIYHVAFCRPLFDALVLSANKFWKEHIEMKVPPTPQSGAAIDALRQMYPQAKRVELSATPEADALAVEWHAVHERAKELDKRAETLKAQLIALMKDADALSGDNYSISYRNTAPREVTDWEAIAKEMGEIPPQVISKHTVLKPGSRRFLPRFKDPQ